MSKYSILRCSGLLIIILGFYAIYYFGFLYKDESYIIYFTTQKRLICGFALWILSLCIGWSMVIEAESIIDNIEYFFNNLNIKNE